MIHINVMARKMPNFDLTMKGKSASNANLWNISNNVTRVNVRYTPSSAIREKIALGAEGIRTRIID